MTGGDDLGRRHRGALYFFAGLGAVVLVTVVVVAAVHGGRKESPTRRVAILMNDASCVTGRSGVGVAPPSQAGQVVVWWGNSTDVATVTKLRAVGVARSFPALGSRVAITGAGRAAVCAHYTDAAERAFAAFRSLLG
ncbi:MAG TPA: hypothetical protein VGL84_02930 [Gaiellaceae bacterium]